MIYGHKYNKSIERKVWNPPLARSHGQLRCQNHPDKMMLAAQSQYALDVVKSFVIVSTRVCK